MRRNPMTSRVIKCDACKGRGRVTVPGVRGKQVCTTCEGRMLVWVDRDKKCVDGAE